jgi:O-antigen/teichoic acid export membrane protein
VALPFLLISSFLAFEYQTDVIVLSLFQDETAVGWYAAATTIVFTLMLVPQAYRAAVFPRMADSSRTAPAALWTLYEVSFHYLGAAALPIAIAVTILSPRIVQLVFGSSFEAAAMPLRILGWALVFLFLTVPNSRLLLVKDRQKWLAMLLVISMGLNIVLNLLLVPAWGASGAATARLCSAAFFFLLNYWYVTRHIHRHQLIRALVPTVVASGVLAACLVAVQAWPLWLIIPIGVAVYAGPWIVIEYLIGGNLPGRPSPAGT